MMKEKGQSEGQGTSQSGVFKQPPGPPSSGFSSGQGPSQIFTPGPYGNSFNSRQGASQSQPEGSQYSGISNRQGDSQEGGLNDPQGPQGMGEAAANIQETAQGFISSQQVEAFPAMSQDKKHKYLMHFMRHIVDIRDRKKASEEALVKQQKVTTDNLRRNEIRLEREKMKQSPPNQ